MVQLHQISAPVSGELSHFAELYDCALQHDDDLLGSILEHVRSRRGKMMRPILVLLAAREYAEVSDVTYNVALALELFHNASLLHDDVVDESNERRGVQSVNSKFGNKLAVLVGDYLLSMALKFSVNTGKNVVVERISDLGITLSKGEVKQQANIRSKEISEADYYEVIRHKTATLFSACGELGAESVDAPAEYVAQAKRLGEIIGMCFQIRDDIFDYYDNPRIGKPTGNDMYEGKLTLPAIHALNSRNDAHFNALAAKVKEGSASADEISELVRFTKEAGGIEYAYSVMDNYRSEAMGIISQMGNADVRRAAEDYIDFVIQREN